MGCDIHIVIERRMAGDTEWIGILSTDNSIGPLPKIAQRDYGFFAEVASVRGTSTTTKYPRNVPRDVSRLAWTQYMMAPTDHHSASYATPAEFVDAYIRANPHGDGFRIDHATYDLLGLSSDYPEGAEYRVVFWFDN